MPYTIKKPWPVLRKAAGSLLIWTGFSLFGAGECLAEDPAPVSVGSEGVVWQTPDFANGLYARKMYEPAISEYDKFIRENPKAPETVSARFRLADSHYFLKRYAKAIDLFKVFLRDYPEDSRAALALFKIGTARYNLGQSGGAVRVFYRVLAESKDPTLRSGAMYYLGKSFESRGKPDRSMAVYLQLIKDHPQSEYASYASVLAGDRLSKEGRSAEALNAYRNAADKQQPAEIAVEAKFKMADIYFGQKDYDSARESYEKLFQGSSLEDSVSQAQQNAGRLIKERALLGLFYCDFHLSDLEAAAKRLEASRSLVDSSLKRQEIYSLMAGLLADKKDFDKALYFTEQALAASGQDKGAIEKLIYKKISILTKKGDKAQALSELEKVFANGPQEADRAFYERGALLKDLEKSAEALADFLAVTEKFPRSIYAKPARYEAGLLYLKMKDPAKARQLFAHYAETFPDDPNAEEAKLEILQIDLDNKEYEKVRLGAEQFLAGNPKSRYRDVAFYKLGLAQMGQSKFTEAAAAFENVLGIMPASPLKAEAFYGAAASYENKKDIKTALGYYEKLVEAYPTHPMSIEVLSRLGYLYVAVQDFDKASACYQKVLFDRADVKLETDGIFWLIRHLLDQSDYSSMQRVLEVLPRRFPELDLRHETSFFLGENAMGFKDYLNAINRYGEAIKLKPEGPFVPWAYLGMGLAYEALRDNVSAEKNFAQALRFDQELKVTLRARFEIANIRLKENKLEEAAKAFMLVAIFYDDAKYVPPALYKAGECFRIIGKPDEAQKAFGELESRYPDSKWTKRARSLVTEEFKDKTALAGNEAAVSPGRRKKS